MPQSALAIFFIICKVSINSSLDEASQLTSVTCTTSTALNLSY